jgi:hypothetical protein
MKYQPPLGAGDNDSYVNGNENSGTEGSVVPAQAVEYPQREIVNAIEAFGLTPDENDLTQLSGALLVSSVGGGGFCADTGDGANYILEPVPPGLRVPVLRGGMRFYFLASTPNVGAADVALHGRPVKSIVDVNGSQLVGGEIAGETEIQYDFENDRFMLVNSAGRGFQSLFAQNGYSVLPDGRIEQWGYAGFSSSGVTIVFPISFPNECFNVLAGNRHQGANDSVSVDGFNTNNFVGYSSSGVLSNGYWRAIGY